MKTFLKRILNIRLFEKYISYYSNIFIICYNNIKYLRIYLSLIKTFFIFADI